MLQWYKKVSKDVDLKVGSFFFGVCGIPAAVDAIITGSVTMNWAFLICWGLGELLTLGWAVRTRTWPMLLNLVPNFMCLLILMWHNTGG